MTVASSPAGATPEGWLVVIDAQQIFADTASLWGSPMWAAAEPEVRRLVTAYGEHVVFTRFVADASLGGSWGPYYEDWPFALVPDEDPLYAVVPGLADLVGSAAGVVTAGTFGKWNADLRAIVGEQPLLTLAGVSTDCCVLSTALRAADAGATVRIAAAACAGSTPENHDRALAAMALYGPQVTVV